MRVGIVGSGSMGNAHFPAWKSLEGRGVEVVGIHSRSPETAQALLGQYGGKYFETYEALLDCVDIVDLCVPTFLHADMTVQAAQAGRQVFCEKPIALTMEEGSRMIAACQQAGVRLFIGQVLRFVTQYQVAQQVVVSGQVGQPAVLRLTRAAYQPRKADDNWFVDEARSGGMILDLMIHDYDYARWLCGDVQRVFAKSIRQSQPNADADYALATLRFKSGAIAHIEGGWAYPPGFFRTSIDIAGTAGLLEWSSDQSDPVHTYLAKTPEQKAADVGLPAMMEDESPFTLEIRHFYDCLVSGEPFSVTPQDALAALQIALAVRESLSTGRSVTITQEVPSCA